MNLKKLSCRHNKVIISIQWHLPLIYIAITLYVLLCETSKGNIDNTLFSLEAENTKVLRRKPRYALIDKFYRKINKITNQIHENK